MPLTDPRARLQALYDWIVNNMARTPETPGCGFGNIKGMLGSGNLSGKCAGVNGLMTGLARAAGFPARDVYGIRVGEGRWTQWLDAVSTDLPPVSWTGSGWKIPV
jgi:transglutaminase-like putative cysteine protease